MLQAPNLKSEHALPSITELGRIMGTIARREAAIELVPVRESPRDEQERQTRAIQDQVRQTADGLLFRQLDALRDVVSTMPAKILSDCVVQVNVAAHMIFRITGCDLEKAEHDALADAVERIMISVLPVLAAAAGLDPLEFWLGEVTDLHEGRFPELAA